MGSFRNLKAIRDGERGVTLVELIVVIGILLVLVGIAVPDSQSEDLAGAEARRLMSDGMRARSVARSQWTPCGVRVHVPTRRWRVQRDDGTPILGPDSDSDGWRTLAPGVRFVKITRRDPYFVFLPNGRTYRDAAIIISDDVTSWEVSSNALSGQINSWPTELP
ncbi:MAG: prepilin-type N-terminal cleavage/methylation domain-containing protein [Planctomycetota bacterium]|nr:MAG: prepilin-type N-terminal cleavage/methylation domain-containing protein [Planctomycetota bacterium]